LEDREAGRTFQGGADRLLALDPQGRALWTYEDGAVSTDLTTVREVRPSALSGDRRVLLVSAFAPGPRSAIAAPSVMGLDSATGKVLWNRNGIPLNSGKVIVLDDRFIVMADDGTAHELIAQSGKEGAAMSALGGAPDWVLEVAGRKLLIAENSHFNRTGPASRVYFRPLAGGADQLLKVPGRVSSLAVAPDKQSFAAATSANRILRFSADGALLWEAEAPPCNILRFSPDGKTVAAAGRDGVARLFNAADGKLRAEMDLNVYNRITADAYAKQKRMGSVPLEAGRTPQPQPPEPSYVRTMPRKALPLGPNLAPPETVRALLKPAEGAAVAGEKPGYLGLLTEAVQLPSFKVKAGATYLVELLDAVGIPTNTSSLLRLEISVAGSSKGKNLPCTVRLPVDSAPARRRFAFRADSDDQVTLTLRPVVPAVTGEKEGKSYMYQDKLRRDKILVRSFDRTELSKIPVVIGDVVVAAMQFPGRNILFDGGPGARSRPYGTFECTLYPVNDGNSATAEITVKKPDVGFRLVNGTIANNKTDWDSISEQRKEGVVSYAEALATLKPACELAAIAVFEDVSGPVINKDDGSVRERAATRYAVDVHKARGDWVRVGTAIDNTQLVNIFPCPAGEIDGIRYVWAGRYDDMERRRTDGFVRTAQIEAYMTGDALDVKDILDVKEGPTLDSPGFD